MNFEKIIKGYGEIFSGLLSFVVIAVSCVLVGFVISYPLWLLASNNASVYTISSLSFFACAVLFLFIRKILKEYKKSPRRLFISLAKKLTLIGGIVLFCYLILNFYKVLAILSVVLTLAIYGVLAFGISPDSRKTK